MGAGNFNASLGLAGHDPIATAAPAAATESAGSPRFDPLTKTYPLNAAGTSVQEIDPVWQEVAHRLGIPLGALSFAPEIGLDVGAVRASTPGQAQRTVEDVVKRALQPMIERGDVKVVSVVLRLPWSGKWEVWIQNLRDVDAEARAFASP